LTAPQVEELKPLIDELAPKINSYLYAISKTVRDQDGRSPQNGKGRRSKIKDQKEQSRLHAATA